MMEIRGRLCGFGCVLPSRSTRKMLVCASVLACHDVLATIFDHLAPGSNEVDDVRETGLLRKSCRKALASSTVVSSTISNHALNTLWRELDSVHPLLVVLPNYKRVGSRFTLCGPILPEHWSRFQLYADCVRVIHGLQGEPEENIHPSIWLFLAAKCKGSALMPRLRQLFVHNLPISEISALTLLISPMLRVADLSFVLEDEDDVDVALHVIGSLLHTLPFMAPNLEDLSYDRDFSIAHEPPILDHGHLESFRHYSTRLKALSIGCEVALTSDQVLRSLASIPTLQDLSCPAIFFPSNAALALPQDTFPQLTNLHLGGHFDHLVAFFQTCQLPRLASVKLQVTAPSTTREPKDSLAAICRRCDPATLTSLSLEIFHGFRASAPLPNTLVQIFEPLLAFPNITSFHFYCFCVVPPVHDIDLARFSTAWPRLASFRVSHLAGHHSLPDVARPTLPGLIDFARRCPRLDVLHIPELGAAVVPDKTAVPLLEHGLRYLTMQNVSILSTASPKMCMDVAAVLDRVFPALDLEHALSVSAGRASVGHEWRNVLRFLEAMRLGRENRDGGRRADVVLQGG